MNEGYETLAPVTGYAFLNSPKIFKDSFYAHNFIHVPTVSEKTDLIKSFHILPSIVSYSNLGQSYPLTIPNRILHASQYIQGVPRPVNSHDILEVSPHVPGSKDIFDR